MTTDPAASARLAFPREALTGLIAALQERGFQVVGPVVRDGVIVYDTIEEAADLPAGWIDEQAPGAYRLTREGNGAIFAFVVGPQSWKKFLHPPEVQLCALRRNGDSFEVLAGPPDPPRYAFLGVRACELAAMAVQDRVLMKDRFPDKVYCDRRAGSFIVAVNCTRAAATCFCDSMGTGPGVTDGFDIALTELPSGVFVAEAGSDRGREVLAALPCRPAAPEETTAADSVPARTAAEMQRKLDTRGLHRALREHFEHPRWHEVAARCLTCANCTMVCPTCFCTTVEDTSNLSGTEAARLRRWDSCFTQAFSYIHGGSVRLSPLARYRQWLMHKLCWWVDQFGTSGCVGCGRCITWCPARIDITEEAAALRTESGVAGARGELKAWTQRSSLKL